MKQVTVVYSNNGIAVRAYSQENWAKDSLKAGEIWETIPFDPPIERTYRVNFIIKARENSWTAEETGDHHTTNLRYLDGSKQDAPCLYWYIRTTDGKEAIAKAKEFLKESIR